jgi:hypothetical protein
VRGAAAIYRIKQINDDPVTLEASSSEAMVGKFTADDEHETATRLLKRAKAACEKHRRGEPEQAAKLSVALDWTPEHGNEGMLCTAPGTDGSTYACEEDEANRRWFASYDEDELGDYGTLELAQAACQHHRDTELIWRESAPELWVASSPKLWPSENYSCELAKGEQGAGAVGWQPQTRGGPAAGTIGSVQSLEGAKEVCQEHHRADDENRAFGHELIDAKEAELGKPERELVTRRILTQLTVEEKAEVGRRLGELDNDVELAELAIAAATEDWKRQRKELEAAHDALRTEKRELRQIARFGEEWREMQVHEQLAPDDGTGKQRDVIYTDPKTGKELDRREARPDELQKCLPGCGAPPDKPPTREEAAAAAEALGPEAAASMAKCEELAAGADPLPADVPLTRADFTRLSSGAYVTAGEPHYRIEKNDNGLWQVLFGVDGAEFWRELPDSHKRLKDAIEQAATDNVTRLRWTPIPGDETQLFAGDGAYQVRQATEGSPGWLAYHGETLLAGDRTMDQAEAQAACQAHADEQRGAGQ